MALLKVVPGDIVAIPCKKNDNIGFVLSRVIRYDVVLWIEVFSDFFTDFSVGQTEVLEQDFSTSNRLFNPIYASFDFNKYFGKIKWPILAHSPNYNPEVDSKYSNIEFEDVSYEELGLYLKGGELVYEKNGIRRNLEDRTIYSNPQLVTRINLYMSGYLKKGTVWNYKLTRAITKAEGKDWWRDQIEYCTVLVDIVAQKFKDARKNMKKTASKRT
jgi:hypothetical protein